MNEGIADALMVEAIQLEGIYFQDMTLEGYPQILEVLDRWGIRMNPAIEHAHFYVLEQDGDGTTGAYNKRDRSMGFVLDGLTVNTICHEMIHHYEYELDELDESLRQYLTIKLWQKLSPQIPDLENRVLKHIEATEHRKLQNEGGQHDVLFLLKSYDIDTQLSVPLGTTFGYGYNEPID